MRKLIIGLVMMSINAMGQNGVPPDLSVDNESRQIEGCLKIWTSADKSPKHLNGDPAEWILKNHQTRDTLQRLSTATLHLKLVITKNGEVGEATILNPKREDYALMREILLTSKKMKWEPAMVDNHLVCYELKVPIKVKYHIEY